MGGSPESGGAMHARRWIAVGCLLPLVLAGCGGGSMTVTDQSVTAAPLVGGNWAFQPVTITPSTPAALPPFSAGSVSVNGSQVSADVLTLLLVTANCPITNPDVMLSGTVAKGQISLTSASWNGAIFTVTGTVASDGQSISATWSAKGGCVDGQSGSLAGYYVAPVTGTWTGTASNSLLSTTTSPLAGANVTFQLQQSSSPTRYAFPLAGSVTVSGTNWGFQQGTLIQESGLSLPAPSLITGEAWTILAKMDDGKSLLIAVGGPLLLKPNQAIGLFEVSGGACDGAFAQLTLTKQ